MASEWEKMKNVFGEIAECSHVERQTRLEGLEPSVRAEMERLLAGHDAAKTRRRMVDSPMLNLPDLIDSLGDIHVFYEGQILVERFEIIRLLGRGGMGEVYEAFDTRESKPVAIKTIRLELQTDSAIRERFRVEVDRARKVSDHPNICRVEELFSFEQDGIEILFFSMELVPGATLFEKTSHSLPMPEKEALRIALQVCSGLEAAHNAGLVHRDLKSSNIILSDAPAIAKITDFGLARDLPSDGDSLVTGSPGTASGTLAYMAPEILEGRAADKASDIYALGVVLYRMVTARYPFEAKDQLVSAAMRLRNPPTSPRTHVPQLSEEWHTAIMGCLAGVPAVRPGSAAEVAGLLQGFPSAIWAYRTRVASRFLTRREVMAALVIGCGAVLGGAEYLRRKRPPFAGQAVSVLIEDFTSPDPGEALGRAARNMLRTAWSDSPNPRVLRPHQIAAAAIELNLGAVPLRGAHARRLAQHAGAVITIEGSLEPHLEGYRIRLAAVWANTGETITRREGAAADGEQIAPAIERLATTLQAGLTGSTSTTRIEPGHTSRPDALESFTSGVEFFQYGEVDIALNHLQAATRIDPSFAMAYVYQAIAHSALRHDDRAFEPASRAFTLRNSVNERQRIHAEAVYYHLCGDYKRGLDTQLLMTTKYPTEPQLHRHVAHAYSSMEFLDEAIHHAGLAVRFDPQRANNYMILASTLAQAARFSEARKVLENARARKLDSPVLRSSEATIRMIEGDTEGALAVINELEPKRGYSAHAAELRARCLLLAGKLNEARTRLDTGVLRGQGDQDTAHEDLCRWWLGQLLLLETRKPEVFEHLRTLTARPAQPYSLFALRSAARLAFKAGDRSALDTAVASLEAVQKHYPSSRTTGFALQGQGLQTRLSKQPERARRLLTQAHAVWSDIANTFELAELSAETGAFDTALPLYESVIARKGTAVRWEEPTTWVLSHVGAARCCRAMGLAERARQYNEMFIRLWGTETHLAVVREAIRTRDQLF